MKNILSKLIFTLITMFIVCASNGQSIVDIRFNLYADSVKNTIDNYINVEARLSNGRYIPLTANEINFSSDYGFWRGNSLVLSKVKNVDAVNITAQLKSDTSKKITTTVYIQKYPDAGFFLSEKDFMNKMQNRRQPAQRQQRRFFY